MTKITSLTAQTSAASSDNLPIVDNSGTPTTKKITWANLIKSILTQTKGNIPVSDGTTLGALAVGSNNQILTADSSQTYGVKWASPTGTGQSGDMVYPLDVTIGDYSTPASSNASSDASPASSTQNYASGTTDVNQVYASQTRAGELVTDTTTRGQQVLSVKGYMKKSGSPTGNMTCTIRKSSDDSVVATSSTTLDVSTLTTSMVEKTFTFSNETIPNENYRILFEYSGGDGSNYVRLGGDDPGASALGQASRYTGSYTDQTQDHNITITYAILGSKVFDGNTSTYWQSNSENNPWVSVDLTSARDIASVAINLNTSVTTETAFKIQTSVDGSSWTDQRYVNVSDFTNNTWRFFPINRLSADARYVRLYGQGSSKVLAIYEIKVYYSPTTTEWNRKHYHRYLAKTSSDNTLDSN